MTCVVEMITPRSSFGDSLGARRRAQRNKTLPTSFMRRTHASHPRRTPGRRLSLVGVAPFGPMLP